MLKVCELFYYDRVMTSAIFYPILVALVGTVFCLPAWVVHQKISKTKRQYFWRYITLILLNGSLSYLMTQPVAQNVLSHPSNVLIASILITATFIVSEYWCLVFMKKYGHAGEAFMFSNFVIPVVALVLSLIFLSQDFQPRGMIYFCLWLWMFLIMPVWMYEFLKTQCQRWWKYLYLFYAIELYLFAHAHPRLMMAGFLIPLFCALMAYTRAACFKKDLGSSGLLFLFYYVFPTFFVLCVRWFT